MSEEIEVEAIEDIRNFAGVLIARKGRKGIIWGYDSYSIDRFGFGPEVKEHRYFSVLFDGNKINRDVPNKSIKRICGNGSREE